MCACVHTCVRAQALQDISSPAESETLTIKNHFPLSLDFLSLKEQIICIHMSVNNCNTTCCTIRALQEQCH